MSKYVKDLVSKEIARRLDGVSAALLVNVVGLDAGKTHVLRRRLGEKSISLMVVKSGLAKRATEGTPLAAAFHGVEGSLAMVWGCEDFVSLAKEITTLTASPDFPAFETRGGVMDGEHLTAEGVKAVSLWPSREDQIRILLGQILSPGANLASQLLAPGGALASQIKKKAGEDEPAEEAEGASEAAVEAVAELSAGVKSEEPPAEEKGEGRLEDGAEPKTEEKAEGS
jgi:ribosomal protein L10